MRANSSHSSSQQGGLSGCAHSGNLLPARRVTAFTLTEMLVVIAVIAIIATIALPSLEGLMKSNTMTNASRQLLDDVAYARQKAISGRTTVYMVFVPPNFWDGVNSAAFNGLNATSRKQANTLLNSQYTSYALYVERSLGDQPGRYSTNYITAFRSLPDGVLIETNKFNLDQTYVENIRDPYNATRQFDVRSFQRRLFPFPPAEITNAVPRKFELPYIAFNPQGGLTFAQDEFLPIARGSIFYQTNSAGQPLEADVVETAYREATRTNYTLVRIDALTGRAKLERIELE